MNKCELGREPNECDDSEGLDCEGCFYNIPKINKTIKEAVDKINAEREKRKKKI